MKKYIFLCTITLILVILSTYSIEAHPGRLDQNGGHRVLTEGWGFPVGTYHFHSRYNNIIPVSEEDFTPLQISVIINRELMVFDESPQNIDGSVMVPLRLTLEQLGYLVEWYEATATVYVNGESLQFEGYQIINSNGRLLVPVRFLLENLGFSVEWYERLQIVYIQA